MTTAYEWNLMSKCCGECVHTEEDPCKNYILCRTEGPLCHNDKICRQKKLRAIAGIKHGKYGIKITVSMGSCGLALGANKVFEAAKKAAQERNLEAGIEAVGCMGLCYAEPIVEMHRDGFPDAIYGEVKPEDVGRIFDEYLCGDVDNAFALRNRTGDAEGEEKVPLLEELDFYRLQVKWVTRNCGIVNPESIADYIARGGYRGLHRALSCQPSEVIEEIKKAGLRGRGGAGFPTWLKWSFCRNASGSIKYMICNADEGDPGAFMNRMLAEADPYRVVEGLVIAAYAIGAVQGYIFVRAEKPLMADRLEVAVDESRKYGLLGKNIVSSGFSFDVEVVRSAGAFVCGEETALIAAIEGRRAMPRQRPPFPATSGLFGKPTTINNVETLAHVATIMADGWEKFVEYGTERSKGTKVFCITGCARRTGAAEVPIGTTMRDLIFGIAGGVREGRKFKAVQIGGPSGGCLPEAMLDLPVDYESLQSAGAIMGSGGLVVIDDGNCIVDVSRYFTTFTTAESCGKCFPCRMGTKTLYDTLTRITEGDGVKEDIEVLEDVGRAMADASLCALGQTAPNPVLSTLRYFPDEYKAHIENRECPARVCSKLVDYAILEEDCVGCGLCAKNCQAGAIFKHSEGKYRIDVDMCVRCGQCFVSCPRTAVVKR